MEMFELKYFNAVAELESIQAASERLHVSGPALSKAVSRLEDELGVELFYKTGRNIKLTPQGKRLKQRALEILELEKEIKYNFNSELADIKVRVAGPEVFQSNFGLPVVKKIKEKFPLAQFRFTDLSEDQAINLVLTGEADFTITTRKHETLKNTLLEEVEFQTFIGAKHPLASRKAPIPIKELLLHEFVIPSSNILGDVSYSSADGWREDKFSRKITYHNTGIETLVKIVEEGLGIAYLPDYFGNRLGLSQIKITGCPYTCKQKIYLNMKQEVARWLG